MDVKRLAAVIVALLLTGLALAARGCSPGGVEPLPAPPTTQPRPATTAPPDYSNVQLAAVPGRTTTTVAIAGGKAVVKGVVVGPDGPVDAAIVHLERLVGDDLASHRVATAPDGTFAVPDILGGRYRVRAYRPSDLALVKPEVFFLGGSDTKELTLRLDRYSGVAVAAAIAPDPPVASEPANVVVQVTYRSVDADGIVRAVPVPGVRIELFPTGRWTIEGNDTQAADAQGRAVWRVRCDRAGEQGMSALVGDNEAHELQLPACLAPPPSTTSTTTGGSTSSTSSSSSSSSSTSTTRSTTTSTTR